MIASVLHTIYTLCVDCRIPTSQCPLTLCAVWILFSVLEMLTYYKDVKLLTSAAVVCSYCQRSFNGLSKKRDLKRHIDSLHLKLKLFDCDHCSYSSSQKSNVKGHMVRMHGAVVTTRNYSTQPNQYTLKRQRQQGKELG